MQPTFGMPVRPVPIGIWRQIMNDRPVHLKSSEPYTGNEYPATVRSCVDPFYSYKTQSPSPEFAGMVRMDGSFGGTGAPSSTTRICSRYVTREGGRVDAQG